MRIALTLLLMSLMSGSAGVQTISSQDVSAAPLTLADLERMALERNPTVQQAQSAVDAARGRARQAGTLPNPIAGDSGEELTTGALDPRGEHGFFVEQTIPLGGKLRLGRQVFEHAAERAAAEVDLQRQRIVSTVRTLFCAALTEQRRIDVHDKLTARVGSSRHQRPALQRRPGGSSRLSPIRDRGAPPADRARSGQESRAGPPAPTRGGCR